MVMTAGAARGERLEKSTEQLQLEEEEEDVIGAADDDETESFFPEERFPTPTNLSFTAKNYHRKKYELDDEKLFTSTTERTRFERISLKSYSAPHEATSQKSVLFRTRF